VSGGPVNKTTRNRIGFVVASAVALALPPLLLPAEPDGLEAARKQVAAMTQTERDRFERNSREYLNLSEQERAQYRSMHAELRRDREENQGRLEQALTDYYAWLSTLQSFPRQELRATTDPQQRVEKVAAALEDQSQRQLRELPWTRPLFGRYPPLSPDQLSEMMAVLERGVTLNQEQSSRLQSRSGVERHLEFFRILRERDLRLEQLLERTDEAKLLAVLPEDDLPDWSGEENIPQRRRSFISQLLFWNLSREYQLEIQRRRPGEADLRAFVQNWPADQQAEFDQLLEQEPDEFRQRLERAYAARHLDLDWEVVPQVVFGRDFLDAWRRGPRGPGSRPQFDGDRRPEGRGRPNDPDRRPPER
jgi:hypothetical protein